MQNILQIQNIDLEMKYNLQTEIYNVLINEATVTILNVKTNVLQVDAFL